MIAENILRTLDDIAAKAQGQKAATTTLVGWLVVQLQRDLRATVGNMIDATPTTMMWAPST